MAKGLVLVYISQLGGRLCTHQKIVLEADAAAIAKLMSYDFGGQHRTTHDYFGPLFFVPDDTLLSDEAASLGIRSANDLYGGVVSYSFIKTKAITHMLFDSSAERPPGWSSVFAERVREVALPGYTAFSARDARAAARHMLRRGPIRVKKPLGASGRGQRLISSENELELVLDELNPEELATYGLVLEENLREVKTLSVGRVAIDAFEVAYYGTQRTTKDNEGRAVYGGSDLVCVRGGWDALRVLPMDAEVHAAVSAALVYDTAMSEYPGCFASRRNYDIAVGVGWDGQPQLGVLEASWRIGGASSAELMALAALRRDSSLGLVRAAHVEEFGMDRQAPADAIVHFEGEDPDLGPLLRYTVVKQRT